mmetsp:Transcript_36868/g.73517  ORF Transcript_36868/g.73517 Transcript_36868/m.73517 type:complete len:220 (-) Transcript_36868:361-1020(-)
MVGGIIGPPCGHQRCEEGGHHRLDVPQQAHRRALGRRDHLRARLVAVAIHGAVSRLTLHTSISTALRHRGAVVVASSRRRTICLLPRLSSTPVVGGGRVGRSETAEKVEAARLGKEYDKGAHKQQDDPLVGAVLPKDIYKECELEKELQRVCAPFLALHLALGSHATNACGEAHPAAEAAAGLLAAAGCGHPRTHILGIHLLFREVGGHWEVAHIRAGE